jgi:hypothetical protein
VPPAAHELDGRRDWLVPNSRPPVDGLGLPRPIRLCGAGLRVTPSVSRTEVAVPVVAVVERPFATGFDRLSTADAPGQACSDERGKSLAPELVVVAVASAGCRSVLLHFDGVRFISLDPPLSRRIGGAGLTARSACSRCLKNGSTMRFADTKCGARDHLVRAALDRRRYAHAALVLSAP